MASKFENQDEVGAIIYYLTERGFINTYDWRGGEVINKTQAELDMNGVKDCDFIVGIFGADYLYKGAIAEIGMAMVLGKQVFIMGNWLDKMIFMQLPNVKKITKASEILEHYNLV